VRPSTGIGRWKSYAKPTAERRLKRGKILVWSTRFAMASGTRTYSAWHPSIVLPNFQPPIALNPCHVPWGEVALRTFWPKFTPNADAATVIVGVFGTTISPYLFFWQASEEVEDMQIRHGVALLVRGEAAAEPELRRIRWDTWSGMFYSDISAYFIILACAVTLNVAGVTDIETAAQAASALRPLAGEFAYVLFALRIIPSQPLKKLTRTNHGYRPRKSALGAVGVTRERCEGFRFLHGPTMHQPIIRIPAPWEVGVCPPHLAAFLHAATQDTPLINLAPEALLSELTADYVYAQLCNAALHAFAAENEARMQAMSSARHQIEIRFAALEATQRRVRQEEITAEIIELAAGEMNQSH
jgi:hypothetical protein